MKTITYNGKEYPIRTLLISIEGEERMITIATQELSNAMGNSNEVHDTEANDIDCGIYYYVDNDEILNLEGIELCSNWLDEPLRFVEDIDQEKQYIIQDIDEDNVEDLRESIAKEELLALIDENTGGIIGYINEVHAKRIMNLLNSIPYLEANLRKLN